MTKDALLMLLLGLIGPVAGHAQQAYNPETYGIWTIENADGFSGSIVHQPGACQYNLTSSIAHFTAFCTSVWNQYDETLTLFGDSAIKTHTVPEYRPSRIAISSTVLESGTANGRPYLTFTFYKITRNRMLGHIIGAGENQHVTLTRH